MQRQLETLEEAFVRQEKEVNDEKLRKWQEIQRRAPDLAEFLQLVNKAFGKVVLGLVEFK